MVVGMNNPSNRRLICPACKILLWKDAESIPLKCPGCERVASVRASFKLWLIPCTFVGCGLIGSIYAGWFSQFLFTPVSPCRPYRDKYTPLGQSQLYNFRWFALIFAILLPFFIYLAVKRKRTLNEITDEIESDFNRDGTMQACTQDLKYFLSVEMLMIIIVILLP